MNRLTKFFVSLYPTAWRNRYESEFAALLEELNPKWRSSLDILKGAITMQLRTVSFGKIVIATGLVGLLLGLCAWLVIPNRYVSMSLIRINSPKELLTDRVLVMAQAALSRSALNTLVQKYDLYPQQRAKLPLEDILTRCEMPFASDLFSLFLICPNSRSLPSRSNSFTAIPQKQNSSSKT